MSRIKLLLEVVEDLKRLSYSMEALAEVMQEGEQMPDTTTKGSETMDNPGIATIEQVREVLAEKFGSGKKAEVRGLIRRYGGEKLADVDPSKYGEIAKEAANL